MKRGQIDWQACAERLAAEIPRTRLHSAVLGWSETRSSREPWAVAFSGGADSLALLLLVWSLWPERRKRLVVLHFNHRLRGVAADRDEAFCRGVAKALSVRFRSARWSSRPKKPSEAEARDARHQFFSEQMKLAKSRELWLGHQQDDVAETMLMRIARGSGTAGLSAPRPVQTVGRLTHLRPLLRLKKAELELALSAVGAIWRTDASNGTPLFLRNRIRLEVIPRWMAAHEGRDALAGAALARELLEEDDSAIETWLAELNPFFEDGSLDLTKLAERPRALARRALQAWLARCAPAVSLSRQAVNLLIDDLLKNRATWHSLGRLGFARIKQSRLIFERGSQKVSN